MSLCEISLIGRLGKDPEATKSGGGCKFSVACDVSYKDKDGNKVDKTEWTNVIVWGKLADLCLQYLSKGRLVFVRGDKQTETYEKDGATQYMVQCRAQDVQFLGKKDDGGGKADDAGGDSSGDKPSKPHDDDVPF